MNKKLTKMTVKEIVLSLGEIFLILIILLFFSFSDAEGMPKQLSDDLKILDCAVSTKQVKKFEHIEIDVKLQGKWDNPFDKEQISVLADIRTPSERKLQVSGFYYQDYTPTHSEGRTTLKPAGSPFWKVRFTPTEIGFYTIRISVHSKGRSDTAQEIRFECIQGERHGFIRVSPRNRRYFAFDDGTSFYAIG